MFYEIGIFFHPVSERVQERGFQSAKAIVIARDMRFAEFKGFRITLTRQLVDNRTTWIAQPHHLGTLVDSLSCRIVDSLSQHFHIIIRIHTDNLRVSS